MTQLTEFSATSVELEEVIQYFTQVLQGIKGNQVSINKRDDTTNIIATGPTGFSSVEIQHIGNPTAYQCKVSTQSSSDAMNIDEVARKLPFTPSEMREFASYMPLLKTLPFAYGD